MNSIYPSDMTLENMTASTPYYQKTTIHGIIEFVEANSKLKKSVWGLIFILALIAMVVEIYNTVENYQQSPILTTYEIKTVTSMTLPTIYVCTNNAIDNDKVIYGNYYPFLNAFLNGPESSGMSEILMSKRGNSEFYLGVIPGGGQEGVPNWNCVCSSTNNPNMSNETSCNCPPPYPTPPPLITTTLPPMKPPENVWELIDEFAVDTEQIFVECSFGGERRNCSSLAKPIFDIDYGRCFLLQINETQNASGKGLVVLIDSKSNAQMASLMTGIVVTVLERYNPLTVGANKIYVSSHTYTKISLQATKIQQINVETAKVQQKCIDEDVVFQLKKFTYVNMSNDLWACKLECVQKMSMNSCHCLMPFDKNTVKKNFHDMVCNYSEYLDCFNKTSNDQVYKEALYECHKDCMPLCNQWKYQYSVSSAFFNYDFRNILHRMNITGSLVVENFLQRMDDFIVLDVAFSDVQYTKVSQSHSMTFDTMVSNIGGQLGLWIGASLLSIIQLGAAVFSWIKEKTNKNGNNKKNRPHIELGHNNPLFTHLHV